MRVRVLRWTDPTSSVANLVIDRWCSGQWERVPDLIFGLHQSERANEVAMGLSLSKRIPVEIAVFEDGHKVEGVLAPLFVTDNGNGETISDNQ